MTGELRSPEHRAQVALSEIERERLRAIDVRLIPRRVNSEGASAPDALCEPTNAAYLCAKAARLVGSDRATAHGDINTNFSNIAELWNGYWRIKCRVNDERLVTPFTPLDVGNMLELLKIARRFSGSFNADDYVDAAGYAGCTGEIAANEQKTPPNTD